MKAIALMVAAAFLVCSLPTGAWAGESRVMPAAASLFLPGTGQAMNGDLGSAKTKVMGAVETGSIITLAILGGVVGGPVIWAGLGPLLANHAWSSADAFINAGGPDVVNQENQLAEAERILQQSLERQRLRDRGQYQAKVSMSETGGEYR